VHEPTVVLDYARDLCLLREHFQEHKNY
jgi:hypothetical protein